MGFSVAHEQFLLLYPEHLTSSIFTIIFSNQKLVMFKSILMLQLPIPWLYLNSFCYDKCQMITKGLKKNNYNDVYTILTSLHMY